jgi:type III secretory pathway component EscT
MVELLSVNTDTIRSFIALLSYYLPRTMLFVAFMPLLGRGANSALIKSAIGIAIVLIPVQIAFSAGMKSPAGEGFVVFTLMTEVMLGTLLGLTIALPYYIFMAFGALIDVYRGATFAAQANGQDSGEQLPLETLFGLLFTALIFAGPGLHAITQHLLHSYALFPPGLIQESSFSTWALALVQLVVDYLAFALLLSGPILIIIMLVEFAMEILSSFTPQMQVYSLQFGLRSVFGVAALMLFLEFAEEEIFRIFGDYSHNLSTLLGLIP